MRPERKIKCEVDREAYPETMRRRWEGGRGKREEGSEKREQTRYQVRGRTFAEELSSGWSPDKRFSTMISIYLITG